MSKSKLLIKYEVINTKKNKNLIGEVFDFKKVKVKGGSVGDGGKKPPKKQKSTRDLLIEFMGEQRAFNKQQLEFNESVMQRLSDQAKFNKQQLEFNKTIANRLDRIVKVNNLKE